MKSKIEDLSLKEFRTVLKYVPQCVYDFAYKWAAFLNESVSDLNDFKFSTPIHYRNCLQPDEEHYAEGIEVEVQIHYSVNHEYSSFTGDSVKRSLVIVNTITEDIFVRQKQKPIKIYLDLKIPSFANPCPEIINEERTNRYGIW